MERYIVKWGNGTIYRAASDGAFRWSWHLAQSIAGIIGGTMEVAA